jgi:hypothetical protein
LRQDLDHHSFVEGLDSGNARRPGSALEASGSDQVEGGRIHINE